ncbi:tyrosine-type recombinase/integrase [Kribbella sp. NPDC003505]|uniref:tyrosine-type recombinase/integrase n=1 Tax=Kribbella sp. NPDC003505 TaxID=3154448 RepID=UPI0033A2D292
MGKRRGHIEEVGGKFRGVASAGRDPVTGRRRQPKTELFATAAEAEAELLELHRQIDEERQPKSRITVSALIEKWFDVAELEDSTRERYEGLNRKYIEPAFGSIQFAKLDPEHLETFYSRLRKCRYLCDKRRAKNHICAPLAPSSVRQIHAVLAGAGQRGVRWKYFRVNPAELAKPPAAKKGAPDPPNEAEAAAILNEAWKTPAWGALLWTVMVTGCRRGELCALRWSDIDLDRAKVTIDSALTRKLQEKSTKSEQDRRISIDPYTVEMLRSHKKRAAEQCNAAGITLGQNSYVFSLEADFSKPMRPDTVTQRYRRLAARNGLRSTRIHSLRHYSATELLAAGVDLKTVSGRLGHASGSTTLRFYAAWLEEADKRAAGSIATKLPVPDPLRRVPRTPYERVLSDLREAIEGGEYRVGSQLPSNETIRAKHKVSTGTVSRAIAALKEAGMIEGPRGKRPRVIAASPKPPTPSA